MLYKLTGEIRQQLSKNRDGFISYQITGEDMSIDTFWSMTYQ